MSPEGLAADSDKTHTSKDTVPVAELIRTKGPSSERTFSAWEGALSPSLCFQNASLGSRDGLFHLRLFVFYIDRFVMGNVLILTAFQ